MTNQRTRAAANQDRLSARSADPGMVVAFDKVRTSGAELHPAFSLSMSGCRWMEGTPGGLAEVAMLAILSLCRGFSRSQGTHVS